MTQLEHVVLDFIEHHPHCTSADILSSFASHPAPLTIHTVIDSLTEQNLIDKEDGEKLRRRAYTAGALDA